MSDKIAEPIDYILNSQLSGVLSKGFSELYRVKPDFPISYLGKWLKKYSQREKEKKINEEKVNKNIELFEKRLEQQKKKENQQLNKIQQKSNQNENQQRIFKQKIQQSSHLEDLLFNWVPQYLQQRYKLSGCYIGNLTHPHKQLQKNNFQPGAQFDTQTPKIIQYIGTSDSHKTSMLMKILPSQNGVSYPIFNDPQPQQQEEGGQQGKQKKQPKKTYIYVPDVTKNQKIYYFKYPKLGSYACFSLKLKSFLTQQAFDQGLTQYKSYIKNQQDNQNQFKQKVNQSRQQYQDIKKKFDQLQINQEQPNQAAIQEKKKLQQDMNNSLQKLNQIQNNPPKTPLPNFKTVDKMYLVGCDTLGQDRNIQTCVLDEIDQKAIYFNQKFQQKEKKMLLDDILAFISQQSKLQVNQNTYKQNQKSVISQIQETVKQKYTRQKQIQYQISLAKCKKMQSIFSQSYIQKSMQVYFSYNIPKYQQIYQIALMLLGYKKQQINLHRKNTLNFRKVRQQSFIQEFLNQLLCYELRRQKSEAVDQQYKINKLLQRLQKIQLQQVAKYNTFLYALAIHTKYLCWARLHGKQAKIESYEYSVKAKQQRQQQMVKYDEDLEKHIQNLKEDLSEGQQFNQQQARLNYKTQFPKPLPLEVQILQQFLDIQ